MRAVPVAPLKRVATLNDEKLGEVTPPDQLIRYLDIGAVGRGVLVEAPAEMTFGESPSRARRLVCDGDTIVSTVRTYLRAVWPVRGEDLGSLVVSTGFAVVRPRDIDPRFLAWVLQSDAFIEGVVARSVGVSYPAINPDEIGLIEVPLPTTIEQRRIAAFLDAETERIDQLIATKARMVEAMASRLQALRYEVFDTSSARVPLRRLVTRLTSGPRGWAAYVADEGLPFLRITNVQRSSCVLSDEEVLLVDPPGGSEAERACALFGDVVVSITADIGSVGVVDDRFAGGFVSQHLALLTPSPGTDPEWLANAIMSPECQHQLRASQYGGTKTQLSLEDVMELTIPAVDAGTQRRQLEHIRSESEMARELLTALDAQADLLRERRHSLITAAVTGEMSIP